MTQGAMAAIFVLLALALCWIGSRCYGYICGQRIDRELTLRDNLAFACPYGAYLFGIMLMLGAHWTPTSEALTPFWPLSRFVWGLLGLVLMSLAIGVQEKWLFSGLSLWPKVFNKNASAGIILAGSHIASALIVRGVLSDEGGFLVGLVFWFYAQCLFLGAVRIFMNFSHYHLKAELKRDNCAVALTFAGGMVAVGNLLGHSISGAFVGWSESFAAATSYALVSLVFLYLIHKLNDWLFLPHVTVHDEIVTQDTPNIGVGYLCALFYIGLSLLITASI